MAALDRGPQQYTMVHVPFLWEEFALMVGKGQWVVFPYSIANELPGLRTIFPGVKDDSHRQPRWLGDYSYSKLN